jgi:hypothetical protein
LQRLLKGLGLLGVGIGRVRVELLEHAHDGILHQLVLVYSVDIQVADGILGVVELVEGLACVGRRGENCKSSHKNHTDCAHNIKIS